MQPTESRPAQNASAGNRTRVTSMATMYSTTRPLMHVCYTRVCEGQCLRPESICRPCICLHLFPIRIIDRPHQYAVVKRTCTHQARLAQSAERKALNLVVVGSSPTVGVSLMRSGEHTSPRLTLMRSCRCQSQRSQHSCISFSAAETYLASECPPSIWPRGVTVSTLDSESSDRGSNPREACCDWGIPR